MTTTLMIVSLTLFALCILLPVFHMINALPVFGKRTRSYLQNKIIKNRSMSILVPCYNESGILQTAIEGMDRLPYPNKEVIYINDGSSDNTMADLKQLLNLKLSKRMLATKLKHEGVHRIYESQTYDNVYVIDKVNGGKADALNAGIAFAQNDLVITLDADSVLDMKALDIINQVFQDKSVVAAGGMVHVLQGKKFSYDGKITQTMRMSNIVRFQILEYLKGFYIYKFSLAKANALAIISGAFGVFDRHVLVEVGGYRNTVGEDIDITLRIQQYLLDNPDKRVLFAPESMCYTECPEGWGDLFKQRVRWQKAFIDCIVEYRGMLAKTFLTRPLSFFFLIDSFLTGTVATFFTAFWVTVLFVDMNSLSYAALIFFGSSFVINLIYSLLTIHVSKFYGTSFVGMDRWRLLGTILGDLFLFRFISMFYIMFGTIAYFFNKEGWNKVQRTGKAYSLEDKQAG